MNKSVLSRKIYYENIKVYSIDGYFMFFTNTRRLKFYLEKDLIEKISDIEYKFKFETGGKGHKDRNPFLLIPRKNICVISGSTENLNRHHIIPRHFRMYLPEKLKSHNHQLIVLIDEKKHSYYNYKQLEYYDVLAKKYNIRTQKELQKDFIEKYHFPLKALSSTINILFSGYESVNLEEYKKTIKSIYGENVSFDLDNLSNLIENYPDYNKKEIKDQYDFGKLLMDKVTDYKEFTNQWLKHFIENTNPQFLPEDIKIYCDMNNIKYV